MEILLVLLLVVASFRVTRFITRDKLPLIEIPREAFVERWGAFDGVKRQIHEGPRRWWLVRAWRWLFAMEFPAIRGGNTYTNLVMKSAAYLWECDWCMGVWVSGGVVYAATLYVSVPYPVLVWLTAAAATGLIASYEGVLDKKAG